MNMLHASFAVGAMAGPLIAQLVQNRTGRWHAVYLVCGIISCASAPLFLAITRSPTRSPSAPVEDAVLRNPDVDSTSSRRIRVFTDPVLLLTAFTLASYAAHQTSMTSWLPLFFESSGALKPTASGWGVSAYWIGIIVGRLLAARLPDHADRLLIVAGGAIAGAAATAGVVLAAAAAPLSFAFVVIAGAAGGSLIPLSISEGQARHSEVTGTITAFFSLFLLAGRFVGPWGIGLLADAIGIHHALYGASGALIACAATAAAARASRRRISAPGREAPGAYS